MRVHTRHMTYAIFVGIILLIVATVAAGIG
jgi:hypothetical protein